MTKPVKQVPGSLTVYDAEADSWVEVTHEKLQTASYVHQQVQLGAFISAIAIKKIFDERLYLALNCSSRDEYVNTMLPYGPTQAKKLYRIASRLDEVNKSLSGNNLTIAALTDGSKEGQSTDLNQVAGVGVEKLYELVKLEEDDLKSLVRDGKASLKDGEVSIQDIMDMSAKEVSRLVSENKKKYTNKITQLDEQVKLLKSEAKEKEKLIENLTKANEHAEKIEKTYGPVASRIKDKTERLTEAKELLKEFTQVLVRSGVNAEDPEELQGELKELIRSIHEVHQRMVGNFNEVVDNEF